MIKMNKTKDIGVARTLVEVRIVSPDLRHLAIHINLEDLPTILDALFDNLTSENEITFEIVARREVVKV